MLFWLQTHVSNINNIYIWMKTMHSYQNSISRTFGAEVLNISWGKPGWKVLWNIMQLQVVKSHLTDIYSSSQGQCSCMTELGTNSWEQEVLFSICIGDMLHCIVFKSGKHLPTCYHQNGGNTHDGSRNHSQLQVADHFPVWF